MEDKRVRKAKSEVRQRRQEHLNQKAAAGAALREAAAPAQTQTAGEAPEKKLRVRP